MGTGNASVLIVLVYCGGTLWCVQWEGPLRHCAAILSRKSLAMCSSGPFRGLMKTMLAFGCDFLTLSL